MATNYSPTHFLRKAHNSLLEQYFLQEGVEPIVSIQAEDDSGETAQQSVRISDLSETKIQPIIELLQAQEPDKQTAIENDFRTISERACKSGYRCLLDEARYEGHDIDIADDLEEMENHYTRAMWVFLNHRRIFDNAGHFQRIDRTTFKSRFVWRGLNPRQVEENLEDFKQKVIEQYKKEGRGRHCKIEVLKRPAPERYYYFIYLSDYSDTLEELKGGDFLRTPVKPAFEIIFAYHPESGKIETNSGGKKQDIEKLQEAFCQKVLDMEGLPDQNSQMYDLSRLKHRFNFMPRDPQDNIAQVNLKVIDFTIGPRRRITFSDLEKNSDIYDMIEDSLNENNVPRESVTVTKARIQIVLRPVANETRGKTTTFEISTPDRCTLKDSPIDLIAQKCIEKWGFVSRQRIAVPDTEEVELEASA